MKYNVTNVNENQEINYRQEACIGKQVFGCWARSLVKDLKRKVFVYSGQAEISSNIKFRKYI